MGQPIEHPSEAPMHLPLNAAAKPEQDSATMLLVSHARPALSCYLRLPRGPAPCQRVLVSVHGISRNAAEHTELFGDLADRHGVALVAPEFPPTAFRDYQRLGRNGLGPRADHALIRLLNEIGSKTGIDTSRVDLFGFSGGAQFAHRFALVHPQRVRKLALGAAGWYTMPDETTDYPYGTGDTGSLDAAKFNCLAAARIQTLVMVGEQDIEENDPDLNRNRTVVAMQGNHRVARAHRWQQAMNTYARSHGEAGRVELHELPATGHSFQDAVLRGGLADRMFSHFYSRADLDRRHEPDNTN